MTGTDYAISLNNKDKNTIDVNMTYEDRFMEALT